MNQIFLFCPHCFGKLELGEYKALLEHQSTRQIGCYWCGNLVLTCDINEPAYLAKLRGNGKIKEE